MIDDALKIGKEVAEALKKTAEADKPAEQSPVPAEKKEEPVVESVVEEKVEEDPNALSVSQRVQDRIDALTERMIEKDRKIAELEARTPQVKTEATEEPKVTVEQLQALMADESQKQFHPWAISKLIEIKAEETQTKSDQRAQMFNAQKEAYDKAKEEYPDMADVSTELWQKANEIYLKKGLGRDPDGQYMAAVLAAKELGISNTAKEDITESKKADKEIAKRSLATVSKKSVTTRVDELAKLEKEAQEKGMKGPALNKYLAELEKDRRLRKQNK